MPPNPSAIAPAADSLGIAAGRVIERDTSPDLSASHLRGSPQMTSTSATASHPRFAVDFSTHLASADPEIAEAIQNELGRQRHEIELIASENIVSQAVLEPRARS